jgi:hypothetical protein
MRKVGVSGTRNHMGVLVLGVEEWVKMMAATSAGRARRADIKNEMGRKKTERERRE